MTKRDDTGSIDSVFITNFDSRHESEEERDEERGDTTYAVIKYIFTNK